MQEVKNDVASRQHFFNPNHPEVEFLSLFLTMWAQLFYATITNTEPAYITIKLARRFPE